MSGVSGIQQLEAVATDFTRLGSAGITIVAKVLAEEAVDLVKEGFERGTDPDGNAWAPLSPLSRGGDGGTPLNDTGAHLKNRVTGTHSANSFSVSIPFEFASVHQNGAVITTKKAKALCWGSTQYSGKQGKMRRASSVHFAKRVTIPPRPMLPDGRVPDTWRSRFQSAYQETVTTILGGGK